MCCCPVTRAIPPEGASPQGVSPIYHRQVCLRFANGKWVKLVHNYTDEYDIVWAGGELLQPRETVNDNRWHGMPMVDDPLPKEQINETRNSKGHYRKVNLTYWNQRGDLPVLATYEPNWRGRPGRKRISAIAHQHSSTPTG